MLIRSSTSATLEHSRVHNIQKSNDHSHCKPLLLYCWLLSEISSGLRRSHLVWRQSDSFDFRFVYLHGTQAQKLITSQIDQNNRCYRPLLPLGQMSPVFLLVHSLLSARELA